MKQYCFFLLFLLTPTLSFAKSEKEVRVELIVFEAKNKQEAKAATLPSLDGAVSLEADPQANFGQLPKSELALRDASLRIQKKYRLLLHQGWRQQVGKNTSAVRLEGGSPEEGVKGSFQLRWNQAFYATTDLIFYTQDHNTFHLKDKSTLRLNEIHYIDHPNGGVLILIRSDNSKL